MHESVELTYPLIDPEIPVMLQGATGRTGQIHLLKMKNYGANMVAGVSPTAKSASIEDIPVFQSCMEAVSETGAKASVIMVRPFEVLGAFNEAIEAGCRFIIVVTEGVPVSDCVEISNLARSRNVIWIGPSTPGIAIPGKLKLGFLPDVSLKSGSIGVMSKSGTLSYEIGYRLVQRELGQSLWVGVGGDTVKGMRFADLIPVFENDPQTDSVVLIGEVGGSEEEEFANAYKKAGATKPVKAIIAGGSTREGVTMGHAGALMHGNVGTIDSKRDALHSAGIPVYTKIHEIIDAFVNDSK